MCGIRHHACFPWNEALLDPAGGIWIFHHVHSQDLWFGCAGICTIITVDTIFKPWGENVWDSESVKRKQPCVCACMYVTLGFCVRACVCVCICMHIHSYMYVQIYVLVWFVCVFFYLKPFICVRWLVYVRWHLIFHIDLTVDSSIICFGQWNRSLLFLLRFVILELVWLYKSTIQCSNVSECVSAIRT